MKPAEGKRPSVAVVLALVTLLLAAEAALFVGAGHYLGWPFMLGLSSVTGVIGLVIVGLAIWRYVPAIAARLDQEECLDDRLSNGMLILLAGILLLLPGLITDLLGLILLLPWTRRFILAGLKAHFAPAPVYTVPVAQRPQTFRADLEDSDEDELAAEANVPPRTRAA
jgi:UPF0716 protein FxsA